jgi:hypothetical protein
VEDVLPVRLPLPTTLVVLILAVLVQATIAGPPIADDTYLQAPAWSPDGETLAYAAVDDDSGTGTIWTITPEGKNKTRLTFGTTDASPDWLVT